MNQQRTIVVALGGNALQRQGEASSQAQQRVADETIAQLLPLIQAGHRVAIVHGNGPQVGNIVLHEEAINTEAVPSLPLEDSGAMSQGLIGFWLQQAIHDALATRGVHDKYAASIVTQTVVDQADPAFQNPTKPIGPFYSEEEAKKVQAERGYTVREDSGRGWRRVVPSPKPQEIVEAPVIKALVDAGVLVVSTGGGGIPVLRDASGQLSGVAAVIDKDFGAAKLADTLGADTLLILTSVDAAKVNFGQPTEQALGEVSAEELQQHIDAGQFAAGSMLPKTQAALSFVAGASGRTAIITSLEKTADAINGAAGTRIKS
ncbi:carbamate kinase [Candidatus Saccharibacteria bacterium oral taxon 488]|jgi:carbamate kinase|nr:carbamate kinase [Candidatus Saccharibacteria bacterium oral taxon 488]QJU11308.1 carbamate kinase [Candidatus Saccharibacteria bacterium oral taxon 488]QLF52199.1 carbamate kinase [Candidatus Saccharibacteria bacterium oral taxon 488]